MKTKRIHYAWIVFASCLLLKIGLGGAVMCIAGNFVTPVVRELGSQVSQFTMLVSVEAAAMALLYTTAAKVLNTKRIGFIMGVAALVEVAGIALMSTYQSVYLFYLSGAMIGAGVAFTGYVAIPIIINMWFHKKAGTVLGIIIAVEGLSTVSYNLLTATWIVSVGWRTAYLILAATCLVLSVPALFLFVKRPEEVGLKPYGAEEPTDHKAVSSGENAQWGLTRKQALRSPVFYMVLATCMMYSVGCGVQQYLATFTTMELAQSIPFGASAAMAMSLGCVVSSVILGYVNDRFGVKAGLGWGMLFILLGYSGMIYSITNPGAVIPSSLLVGLGGSMYTVQCPLLARTALGGRHYPSIWSLMMMGNSLVGALSFSPIGLFYDVGGSYRGAFVMAMALYVLAFIMGCATIQRAKRLSMRQHSQNCF